ncbi:MAG: hypothetical protein WC939_04150 [Acholeplasmataceae bacterium]
MKTTIKQEQGKKRGIVPGRKRGALTYDELILVIDCLFSCKEIRSNKKQEIFESGREKLLWEYEKHSKLKRKQQLIQRLKN